MKKLAVAWVVSILGVAGPAAAADFTVTSSGQGSYVINSQANPGLTLTRGQTYTFEVNALNHPFFIKTVQEIGSDNTFDIGVTNNGVQTGTLSFAVPASAPSPLYYQCEFHEPMTGMLTIVSAPSVPATTDVTLAALGAGLTLLGSAAIVRLALALRKRPA